jgi:outer membrane receptor protein involved in Fe transport
LLEVSGGDKGYQIEAEYLYRREWLNLTAGFGHTGIDSTVNFLGEPKSESELHHTHGYVYTNINFPDPVTWTVGVSVDDFDQDPVEVSKVNPKFGVQWDVTDNLRLRGAAFRTIKPALVANRTIEPTQIAGFDQFFDDGNADESWRYGVGVDWRVTDKLFVGAEATWRDLNVPTVAAPGVAVFEDQKEQLHRVYAYWLPVPELALGAQFVYDRFESDQGILTDFGPVPEDLETFSVPLTARYFHPSGFFAGVGVTYVNQRVERTPFALASGFFDGHDDFFIVDASVGYRFPDRMGIASLEVNNLLDEGFHFQDDGFREFRDEPSSGPFFPDLQIVGRVTLNF